MACTSGPAEPLRPWPVRRALAAVAGGLGVALLVDDVQARRRAAAAAGEVQSLRAELAAQSTRGAELAERLRTEARTDPLTGLANLRQWREQLARELDRGRRRGTGVAVAVVDLDRFKQLNDSRGHAEGDAVLREVAAAFSAAVRTVDLVARVGGEEFAVALPDVERREAVAIVERLRTSVPGGTSCSAGLALWDGSEPMDTLQRRADAALYRAKAEGRDRLVLA